MKRLLPLLLCIVFLLSSCSDTESNDKIIRLREQSIYALDFDKLYQELRTAIKSEEDLIACHSLEISFLPDGGIVDVDFNLWGMEKEKTGEYRMGLYRVRAEDPYTKTELFLTKTPIKSLLGHYQEWGREGGARGLDPHSFENRMKQLSSLNLQNIIETYHVGDPVHYELRTDPVEEDLLMGENANTIFLHQSADGQIERVDPPVEYDTVSMSAEKLVLGIEYPDMDYFVLTPYYEKTDEIVGSYEITLGQNPEDNCTYVSTNYIVILMDH